MTMPPYPFGETVTRLRATAATDPYSDEESDLSWDDPDSADIDGVAVEPVSPFEALEVGRDRVDIDLRLYLPYGADVLPLDRVVVRGGTYDVQGARADWHNPYTGLDAGSVVECKQVNG